jgi:hypothetical protein
VFKEFDKGKAATIHGMTIIVDKLNELINLMYEHITLLSPIMLLICFITYRKSRENVIEDLTKKHDKISDRVYKNL